MDIDIDFADRNKVLGLIKHVPAMIDRDGHQQKHSTGVYVNPIPTNPFTGMATIDYDQAEQMGYIKLDLLNLHLYSQIESEEHLLRLMQQEPDWASFNSSREYFEKLIHVSNHWNTLKMMPEPVNTIPRLAMFLAVIRPAKRHLIGQSWKEVGKTIWDKTDDGYGYKRSHAVSYAHLVVVHMNLLKQKGTK